MRKPKKQIDYKKIIKTVNIITIAIIILLIAFSIPLGVLLSEKIETIQNNDPTAEDLWS
jgi:hypothetical protein